MTIIDATNEPSSKYSYLLRKNDVKNLAAQVPALSKISYANSSPWDIIEKEKSVFNVGELVGSRQNGEWKFILKLYSNKTSLRSTFDAEAKALAIHDISSWVSFHISQPPTFPGNDNYLFLSMEIVDNSLSSTSREYKKSGWNRTAI